MLSGGKIETVGQPAAIPIAITFLKPLLTLTEFNCMARCVASVRFALAVKYLKPLLLTEINVMFKKPFQHVRMV